MERKFLEALDLGEGVKLPKAAIEAIMAEHGKDIESHKNTITTLTTERDGLKGQLDTATATLKSYEGMDVEGIKAAAKTWEEKYNTDTKTLQEQLEAVKYGHSVEAALSGVKFTSEGARKAFIADLTAKKLPLQDGKLLGMDDFIKSYQTSDPGAFAPADDERPPRVVSQTSGGIDQGGLAGMRAAMGLPPEKI